MGEKVNKIERKLKSEKNSVKKEEIGIRTGN